ncbi:hypothetical protein HK405_003231 [Cladochytrium tenue]|nr:hypothetical protein HK405_003231 [Cladochytrium tenue]
MASSSSGAVTIGLQSTTIAAINPSTQQAGLGQQANPDGAGHSGVNLTRELAAQNPGMQSPESHSPPTAGANINTWPAPGGDDGFTREGRLGYRCRECDRFIVRKYNMRKHIQTHDSARPRIPCRFCPTTFTRQADLRRHGRFVHAVVPPEFPCHLCGRILRRSDTLRKHIRGCTGAQRAAAPGADAATAVATLPESSVMIGHPGVQASATIAMADMAAAGVVIATNVFTTTGSTTTIDTGVIDEPAPPVRDAAHFSTYEH